jgi:hypothetical protein
LFEGRAQSANLVRKAIQERTYAVPHLAYLRLGDSAIRAVLQIAANALLRLHCRYRSGERFRSQDGARGKGVLVVIRRPLCAVSMRGV